MPALKSHQSSATTKLLLIGDSGSGKTGSLCALAARGYNLRIIDVDNGLDVLQKLLMNPESEYFKADAKAVERVQFVTITDPVKIVAGRPVPIKATQWQRAVSLCAKWEEREGDKVVCDLGPITSWTSQDVLVIDSLSLLSIAALNFILALNGRLGQHPHQSDWGQGQTLVEGFMQMLYDESVKCNVIIMAHIKHIGEEGGPLRGYPNTLGQALPPKIGRYFNNILMVQSVGQGKATKRKIVTVPTGLVELKNSDPLSVKPEYDLTWGLADYFDAVRGESAK